MTFMVNVDSSGVSGSYPVTLTEQWKQPNGAVDQQYTGSDNYYVTVTSGAGISGFTEEAIIAIIVIIAVAMALRRKSRKPKPSGKEKK